MQHPHVQVQTGLKTLEDRHQAHQALGISTGKSLKSWIPGSPVVEQTQLSSDFPFADKAPATRIGRRTIEPSSPVGLGSFRVHGCRGCTKPQPRGARHPPTSHCEVPNQERMHPETCLTSLHLTLVGEPLSRARRRPSATYSEDMRKLPGTSLTLKPSKVPVECQQKKHRGPSCKRASKLHTQFQT